MASDDPLLGRMVGGRYRLLECIGRGGFGAVYRADDDRLEAPCAVKLLAAHLAAEPRVVARFEREAKATSRLRHPNIVQVLDYGEQPGVGLYLVMEHIAGRSLKEALTGGRPLPVPSVVRIGAQIADALSTAHAAGIVHRDLKPANVMLTRVSGRDDFVKLLDFGIAGLLDDAATRLTNTGIAIGTVAYMAPEQAHGQRVTTSVDVYSLGVVLFELATGDVPFRGATTHEVLRKHAEEPPPALRAVCPEFAGPAGLEPLIRRCLAKEPLARIPSIEAVREALLRLLPDSFGAAPEVDPLADTGTLSGPHGTRQRRSVPLGPRSDGRPGRTAGCAPGAAPPPETTGASGRSAPVGGGHTRLVLALTGALLLAILAVVALLIRPPSGTAPAPVPAPSAGHAAAAAAPAGPQQPTAPGPPAAAAPGVAPEAQPPAAAAQLAPTEPPADAGGPDAAEPADAAATADGPADADAGAPAPPVLPPRLHLTSAPPGARVTEGKAVLGKTPLDLPLDPVGGVRRLRVSLRGHRTAKVDVDQAGTVARGELERSVPLTRRAAAAPAAAAGAAATAGDLGGMAQDYVDGTARIYACQCRVKAGRTYQQKTCSTTPVTAQLEANQACEAQHGFRATGTWDACQCSACRATKSRCAE